MINWKDVIRNLYGNIYSQWNQRKYNRDFASLKKRGGMEIPPLERFEDNQLFLVPHADDDLFGGYALSKLQKGRLMYGYYGLTGSNHDIQNKRVRDGEFASYSQSVGIPYFEILDENNLRNIIIEADIKIVYLPSMLDWHFEHRKLNYELLRVLDDYQFRDEFQIIWYCITIPICTSKALIVPMTEAEQQEKYAMFSRIYQSQSHMPLQRFIYHEKINAFGCNAYAAEVFVSLDFDNWKEIVCKSEKEELEDCYIKKITKLRSEINNIKTIRFLSRKFYEDYLR